MVLTTFWNKCSLTGMVTQGLEWELKPAKKKS